MNFKKLSIVLSGLVMILGTTTAFAVWDSLSDSEVDNTINIGEGVTVTVVENLSNWFEEEGTQLVPPNVVSKVGDATEATKTFEVSIGESSVDEDLFLDVRYINLEIDGDANNIGIDLLNFTIDVNQLVDFSGGFSTYDELNILDNEELPNANYNGYSSIYVRVTITLDELGDEDDAKYAAIAGNAITFDLEFLASKAVEV
jgi:hypothetical protein